MLKIDNKTIGKPDKELPMFDTSKEVDMTLELVIKKDFRKILRKLEKDINLITNDYDIEILSNHSLKISMKHTYRKVKAVIKILKSSIINSNIDFLSNCIDKEMSAIDKLMRGKNMHTFNFLIIKAIAKDHCIQPRKIANNIYRLNRNKRRQVLEHYFKKIFSISIEDSVKYIKPISKLNRRCIDAKAVKKIYNEYKEILE